MQVRLREQLFPGWIWRLASPQTIALTFDDGPNLRTTGTLLRVLNDLSVKATLFVTGERCEDNAGLLRECVAEGHLLALHGYEHASHLWRSQEWQASNIRHQEDLLVNQDIPFQRIFRPPFGHFNFGTMKLLRRLHFRGVMWSQHARDWIAQDVRALETRLCGGLHPGGIILLHDGHETTHSVAQALPRLAEEVGRRGWQFVTLSQSTLPQPTHL